MNKIEQEQQLISCIHLKPVLWNKDLKIHKNTLELSKAWDEIAKATNQTKNWCRNKWKYLKKCMRDELHIIGVTRSGDEADGYESDWHHFDSMKFVIDQILPNKSLGNLSDTVDNNKEENINFNLEESDLEMDEFEKNQLELNKLALEAMKKPTRRTKQDKIMDLENRKLALLEKAVLREQNIDTNVTATSCKSVEKDDMMFFQTLLPYVLQISSEDKLLFRQEITNVVLKFAYKNKQQKIERKFLKQKKSRNIQYEDDDDEDCKIVGWSENSSSRKKIKTEIPYNLGSIKKEPLLTTPTAKTSNSQMDRIPLDEYNYNVFKQPYGFMTRNTEPISNFNFIPVPVPYISPDSFQYNQQRTSNVSGTCTDANESGPLAVQQHTFARIGQMNSQPLQPLNTCQPFDNSTVLNQPQYGQLRTSNVNASPVATEPSRPSTVQQVTYARIDQINTQIVQPQTPQPVNLTALKQHQMQSLTTGSDISADISKNTILSDSLVRATQPTDLQEKNINKFIQDSANQENFQPLHLSNQDNNETL